MHDWPGFESALVVAAFCFGGLSPGHWLVRWRTGKDLRAFGSQATGATNAGRALGPGGFAVVLALDAAKGATPLLLGRWLGMSATVLAVLGLAVVAGHIWPVHLGFRGGKGVAPALGAWLVLDWRLAAIGVGVVAAALAVRCPRPLAGLAGFLAVPLAAWLLGRGPGVIAATTATSAAVLWAHRTNLKELFAARSGP